MSCSDGQSNLSGSVLLCRGEEMTVQLPGTQTRSFCYVADLVSF